MLDPIPAIRFGELPYVFDAAALPSEVEGGFIVQPIIEGPVWCDTCPEGFTDLRKEGYLAADAGGSGLRELICNNCGTGHREQRGFYQNGVFLVRVKDIHQGGFFKKRTGSYTHLRLSTGGVLSTIWTKPRCMGSQLQGTSQPLTRKHWWFL